VPRATPRPPVVVVSQRDNLDSIAPYQSFFGPIRVEGATVDSSGFAQIEVIIPSVRNNVTVVIDPVGNAFQRLAETQKEIGRAIRGVPGREVTLRMVTNIKLDSGEELGPFLNRFSDRLVMGGHLRVFGLLYRVQVSRLSILSILR